MKIKKIVLIAAALLAAATVIVLCVLYAAGVIKYAEPAQSQSGKYLFVYFTGNEPEEERIHFAVSDDGYSFEPLNNNEPVIEQTLGKKSVRDPYIIRGNDGCFYIVGTDMRCEEGWKSNYSLVTWKSEDLVSWGEETIINMKAFEGFENTTRAWAPQAIWDNEQGRYMLYWAMSTEENDAAAIYYAYTDDFKTITDPVLLYERENIQTIDADIVYNEKSSKYYMYFKHDEDSKISYVTSDKLTGPYDTEPAVVSHAGSGVEGCQMYNITGTDTWVMIMDEYGKNRFRAEQTTDFENFTKIKSGDFVMNMNQRHGSVISITDEEYDALIRAYGK